MNAAAPRRRKLGLIEYQVGDQWVTRLVGKWPPAWPPWQIGTPAPQHVLIGWRAVVHQIKPPAFSLILAEQKLGPLLRYRFGDPNQPAQPGPGLLDDPPRAKPPAPGCVSLVAGGDHIVSRIEIAVNRTFEPLPRKRSRTAFIRARPSAPQTTAQLN